jgi:hypothetical protein
MLYKGVVLHLLNVLNDGVGTKADADEAMVAKMAAFTKNFMVEEYSEGDSTNGI